MHHLQDPLIREKIIQTNLKRYGTANPGMNSSINQKRIDTNLIRYGTANPMENPTIVEKSLKGRFHISRCIFPENLKKRSIDTWNKIYRDKDEKNTATCFSMQDSTIIYPWENTFKISEMMCRNEETIYAEDCSMLMIYKRVASKFLNKHDIYGDDKRNELCIGLIYQGELVQVMTIGKAKDFNHTYQMYRICTKPRFLVIDGSRRMFEYATKNFEVNSIIAYYDPSKQFHHPYRYLGFNKIDTTAKIKIWYHHNLAIPDDQLFDRDLKKLFGHVDRPKEDMMLLHDWKCIEMKPFDIFSYEI